AAAARPEFPARAEQHLLLVRQAAADSGRLSVCGEQRRFRIERIHMRNPAGGENKDALRGGGGKVRVLRRERVAAGAVGFREQLRKDSGKQQGTAGEAAQDGAAPDAWRMGSHNGEGQSRNTNSFMRNTVRASACQVSLSRVWGGVPQRCSSRRTAARNR